MTIPRMFWWGNGWRRGWARRQETGSAFPATTTWSWESSRPAARKTMKWLGRFRWHSKSWAGRARCQEHESGDVRPLVLLALCAVDRLPVAGGDSPLPRRADPAGGAERGYGARANQGPDAPGHAGGIAGVSPGGVGGNGDGDFRAARGSRTDESAGRRQRFDCRAVLCRGGVAGTDGR